MSDATSSKSDTTNSKNAASLPLRDMANAIRALSMDAVQAANSGHPGLPMGAADIATVLYTQFLKIDPLAPDWPDRDRFVLSAGHGSMLQYALHYLIGFADMTLEEIKNFRQLVRAPQAILSSATPAASKPQPARWGRAFRPRSAWPWQSA